MCTLASAFYRLSLCRLHPEFDIRPDRRAVTGALGEDPGDDPDFYFAYYRGFADLRCRRGNLAVATALCAVYRALRDSAPTAHMAVATVNPERS